MYLTPKVLEIKARRLALNLSCHGLSVKAGLGGNAIFRIESGATSAIHPLRARAIAKTLKCKVADIFEESTK